MFTTFSCRTNISGTLFSNPTKLYYKPIEDQKWPKLATYLGIDILCVLQNINVFDPQSSPKVCQSLKNLIVWPKILNFFIGSTSKLFESAYFPLFNGKWSWQYDLICAQNSLLYKTHVAPKSTKGCYMSSDRYFQCGSEFLCFDSPQGCHTSRNLIVWQKFFNFFIYTISDILKSAYFPLFYVEMVMETWLRI